MQTSAWIIFPKLGKSRLRPTIDRELQSFRALSVPRPDNTNEPDSGSSKAAQQPNQLDRGRRLPQSSTKAPWSSTCGQGKRKKNCASHTLNRTLVHPSAKRIPRSLPTRRTQWPIRAQTYLLKLYVSFVSKSRTKRRNADNFLRFPSSSTNPRSQAKVKSRKQRF